MKMWTRALILLTVWGGSAAASALALPRPARGQDLPSADELMVRFVESIGGAEAVASHTSRLVAGTFAVPAQGLSGSVEVYAAAPDRQFSRIEIGGVGVIRNGYDGEVGWMIHPAMGALTLDGRALDQTRQQADFYAPLHTDLYVTSRETIEEADFEGRATYKVKVTTTWEEEYFEFYDIETGRLSGTIRSRSTPMGDIESTNLLLDYRELDGYWVPMKTVTRALGVEQVFTFERIEFDAVDDAVFELPVEIQALIESAS